MAEIEITTGFASDERERIAWLYWQAFSGKLGRVLGPPEKAVRFLETAMDPSHAISARLDGELAGVVGFKTYEGALVGGTMAEMRSVYGRFGALWRVVLLATLERDVDNDRFLLDGVFVAPEARGRGVGSALLDAICAEAARRGYRQVRLDVIDSNPRARALYARRGFVAGKTERTGLLAPVFGFRASTTMVRDLGAAQ